jgi:broad specificity phosphatase PhoE
MAPDGASENAECLEDDKQYLFIVRHGDRWDYSNPEWKKLPTSRTGDSPLSQLGHRQAHEVGLFLDTFFDEKGMTADEITWLSSPFVRCLQTSNCALDAFRKVNVDSVKILPGEFFRDRDKGVKTRRLNVSTDWTGRRCSQLDSRLISFSNLLL